ncbi:MULTISPECIES: YcxB family protein [unclassified Campylobacter]|nr:MULTISPECIES: YcxB family protein [unclassified Campylobacter]MDA3064554.1 YcxB family protein [Campylobacter sp. JMF_11 EL3]MDA3072495.1 YcxB family protein [Campylobacter sp. VBCF_03 NA9]MDA3075548.1 YcxB family protein [Campylobacter sp. JMF_05 ED3]
MFVFVIVWLFLWRFITYRQIKNFYNTTKAIQDKTAVITFFDDYFIDKTETFTTQLKYDELYKIIETNTHFYLLLSKYGGGSIIVKENCSAELIEFLQKIKREFEK